MNMKHLGIMAMLLTLPFDLDRLDRLNLCEDLPRQSSCFGNVNDVCDHDDDDEREVYLCLWMLRELDQAVLGA